MSIPGSFGGVVPPVCTPLTPEHEIDTASLEALVRFQLDSGVHGLFVLGSTGEVAALTDAQRQQVIEIVVQTVAGEVPVLAGIIDMGTTSMIEHGHVAKRLGVDGLVSTAPYYIRPGQAEIVEHFRAVKESVGLPLFAYEIPANVQSVIARTTILEMAKEGLIDGLKDSSGNDGDFRGTLLDTQDIEGFANFTGSELTVDSALFMGADGVVPGLGNVDPVGYVRLYEHAKSGNYQAAKAEQERLYRLFDVIWQATPGRTGFTSSALGGFKTALMLRGIIKTNVMAQPMTQLNEEETDRVRNILIQAGLL